MAENQSGGIIRVKKGKEFNAYRIIASYPANDVRLSWDARGILWYLLDKPDDWEVVIEDLINKSEVDGETVVRNALRELQQMGYIKRYQDRSQKGKFGKWITEVYELPTDQTQTVAERQPSDEEAYETAVSPHRGFPHADKPDAEKPNPEKPRSENQGLLNNKYTQQEVYLKREEEEEAGAAAPHFDREKLDIAFFEVFGEKPSREQRKILLRYLDWGMDEEVILFALQQTSENNGKALKYTKKILDGWLEKGVLTLEDAKKMVRLFENRKKAQQAEKPMQGGGQKQGFMYQSKHTNFSRFLRNGPDGPGFRNETHTNFDKFREN